MTKELRQKVYAFARTYLDDQAPLVKKTENGYCIDEVYADYHDVMCDGTATEILLSEDPVQSFEEKMWAWYDDEARRLSDAMRDKIVDSIEEEGEDFLIVPLQDEAKIQSLAEDLVRFYKDYDFYDFIDKMELLKDLEETEDDVIHAHVGWLHDPEQIRTFSSALTFIAHETNSDSIREVVSKLVARLQDLLSDIEYERSEMEEVVDAFLGENSYVEYPRDHFLNQEFCVTILMDTGDGNYDFTLNSRFPAPNGSGYCDDGAIPDKASIVWLAKTQGYTKGQLREALNKGDMRDPKGFLESMRVEMANLSSHMSAVTFLVKMTLCQLINLNVLIKAQDRNGRNYDATKNPDCGYLELGKKTTTGLFDCWSGAGSLLETKLEKDIEVPIKYIYRAIPDGGDGESYTSVHNVYGVNDSLWTDTVQDIQWPEGVDGGI